MEFSLFGSALALSRYVPAANVARATRSVLSLVSSERVEVGEALQAQQAKRRATASNETRQARKRQPQRWRCPHPRLCSSQAMISIVVEDSAGPWWYEWCKDCDQQECCETSRWIPSLRGVRMDLLAAMPVLG